MSQNWKEGVILKLPKKGDLSNFNNWRGIALLSIPGKVFCTVLLRRLHQVLDSILWEEQADFRSSRSYMKQIFTLRNIIEQFLEYQRPLKLNFIIFKKAFDSVHRESLWNTILSHGVPQCYVDVFKSLYANSRCCVRTESERTEFFYIATGVGQGRILSPSLCLMAVDFVIKKTAGEVNQENQRMPRKHQTQLKDLKFVDDIVLLTESAEDLRPLSLDL